LVGKGEGKSTPVNQRVVFSHPRESQDDRSGRGESGDQEGKAFEMRANSEDKWSGFLGYETFGGTIKSRNRVGFEKR
jgi:hypothetical protein